MKTNQSETFIVAQSSPTPFVSSPQQPGTNFPLWTVALTAVVTIWITLFAVKLLPRNDQFIKAKNRVMKAFNELYSVELAPEFAIDIEVSNIRTLDNLRSTVQATIYVCVNDVQRAKNFLYEGGRISAAAVDKAVKKRADSMIRGLTSKIITLDELHKSRGNIIPQASCSQRDDERKPSEEVVTANISEQARELLQKDLSHLGLKITSLVIGEIDEISGYYTVSNYFDAQALQHRTDIVQNAILETRKKELDTEEKIHRLELDAEQKMQKYKLDIGRNIRQKEWGISNSLEAIEVDRQRKHLERLKILEEFEKEKLIIELNIELHKNEKERELQNEIETSKLRTKEFIETNELKIKENIESLRSKVYQGLAIKEIEAEISIIQAQKTKLGYEILRAKTAEELTTEIEQAKSKREKLKAEIAAASVENEAQIIERLAKADSIRHNLIPATDADRTVHLIREILPELPKFVEIAQALAPQAGILGDSNIYAFQNGNGEDIGKLMLSTSSLLLIQSLLDGKLGPLLLDLLRSLKNDGKSKEDDRSEVKIP